jgi:hypothetical protein
MLLQTIFIFTFPFVCTIADLQCLKCSQTLDITSSETIDTNRPECSSVNAPYSSCSQLLEIGYAPKGTASILFEASPSEPLVLSNAAQMMTNTTMIWLDKYQFIRTFQIFCFDNNACKTDSINNIYVQGEL